MNDYWLTKHLINVKLANVINSMKKILFVIII